MVDESAEEQTVTEHLSNTQTWMRLVFMVLFGIVFEIGKFVGLLVTLVQFLFTLFTGKPHSQLQRFGYSLAEFYRQIIEFQTYRSETRPYPWTPWPQPDEGIPQADPNPAPDSDPAPEQAKPATAEKSEAETEGAPAKPAKRKTARKRKKNPEQVSHDDEDAPSA